MNPWVQVGTPRGIWVQAGLRLPLPPLPQGRSPENGHRFNFVARMQHEHRRAEPSNAGSVARGGADAIPRRAVAPASAIEEQLRALDPRQHGLPHSVHGWPNLAAHHQGEVTASIVALHFDADAREPWLQVTASDLHLDAPHLTRRDLAVERDRGTASTGSQFLDVEHGITHVVQGEHMPEGLVCGHLAPVEATVRVPHLRSLRPDWRDCRGQGDRTVEGLRNGSLVRHCPDCRHARARVVGLGTREQALLGLCPNGNPCGWREDKRSEDQEPSSHALHQGTG